MYPLCVLPLLIRQIASGSAPSAPHHEHPCSGQGYEHKTEAGKQHGAGTAGVGKLVTGSDCDKYLINDFTIIAGQSGYAFS